MGNPILWWVIGISEVVALALLVRVWRSDDVPVMKAMLTFVAPIPVLGPFIVLWVTRFPNRAAPVLQNRTPRGSGLYSLYWSRVTRAPSPIRLFADGGTKSRRTTTRNRYNRGFANPGYAMTISMYQASAAAFARGLASLANVLRKGAAHAAERKIEDRVFLEARLYPDMLPFAAQVRIVTDFSRGACARLAGQEPPKWEDNETTFAELIARVERALEAVRSFTPAQIDGSETREVTRPVGGKPKTFTGLNYLLQFSLPNFYFHSATAYAILRHNGVALGKTDFIGTLD